MRHDTRSRRQDRRIHPLDERFRYESESIGLFLESLGTPRALTVWLLYKYGEHRQVVELSLDPGLYDNPDSFRRDYCATKLLSKCAGLNTGIDTEAVAKSVAQAAEDQCRETNKRILGWLSGSREPALVSENFFRIQRKIADILGGADKFCFQQYDVGWSAGRTTSAYGNDLSSTRKYSSRLDVTRSALPHFMRFARTCHNWAQSALKADGPCSLLSQACEIVDGNVQIAVPKNAKTDRVICYEPHCNVRLQLAVGNYLKGRLRRYGVDLSDQSINRRRAKLASKTGHLSTIDLRSASDTLATEVIFALLPIDWAVLLNDLRSKCTSVGGVYRTNEKFSSMGNGFTFELESLIFFAICSSLTDNVTVYGDDIIVPTEKTEECIALLGHFGFSANFSKTYSTGWFRESCGMDAFCGIDCTPVYLRNRILNHAESVKFHNRIYDWCSRDVFPSRDHLSVLEFIRKVTLAPPGPQGRGDGHLFTCFDYAAPSKASHGWEGFWYTTYVKTLRVNGLHHYQNGAGNIPARLAGAVFSATTGPRRPFMGVDRTEVDRRRYEYRRTRIVEPSWPSISWAF